MRILLLNPPDQHTLSEAPGARGEGLLESDDFGHFPPLGLLYVLSSLQAQQPHHQLFFHDCVAEGISHQQLARIVERLRPDVVGITSYTIALLDVVKAAETVRRVQPAGHICLGGHHPIAFPFAAAALPQFDSVVVGEGEQAFAELILRLERGAPYEDITGVYTARSIQRWQEGEVRDERFLSQVTVPAAFIEDLDALPPPDRRYIQHISYNSVVGCHERLATLVSTRGCPYRCTFCDVPYKKYRRRSISAVVDEVEDCLALGYREFHFYDDLFNVSPRRVIQFCAELERRGLRISWDFRGRVNTATRESLRRARRAGCRLISFGVETGSDHGLEQLGKGTTVAKIEQTLRWCRQLGIETIADFMIGLPFERSAADVRRHVEVLCRLDPDWAQIAILMVLPGTQLYRDAVQRGLIAADAWEHFCRQPTADFKITHWEEHLTLSELTRLQAWAYRRFYFRPRVIARQLWKTRTPYQLKVRIKGVVKLLRGIHGW